MPPSPLTERHIELQARLRRGAAGRVTRAWASLPGYNEENVDQWLSAVLPVVAAAQRQSVTLTDVYLAKMLRREPLGVDPAPLIAALRGDTDPAEVYTRPFVTLWGKLGEGVPFATASGAALARASSSAAMDVQMAMRAASQAVQQSDDGIVGYERAPDGGACEFCLEIAGAFVKSADAMPLHNNCGCGLEPVTAPRSATPTPETVSVHQHGELGAVLGDPSHSFDGPSVVPH